jgi:hypothetical protein
MCDASAPDPPTDALRPRHGQAHGFGEATAPRAEMATRTFFEYHQCGG